MHGDNARLISTCRICGGDFLDFRLKLQDSPLANELYDSKESALMADVFELEVAICSECKGNQLTTIVSPSRLFSNYSYDSGVSKEMTKALHNCSQYIASIVDASAVILEIGSNDGTLMKSLQDEHQLRVIGIEPSLRHVNICNDAGLNVIHGLATRESLEKALAINGIKFSLVVGNNVFAHIDNLRETIEEISMVLIEGGYFVFEVSYFGKVVQDGLFDTIYHEHMSYHSVTSAQNLLQMCGFSLVDVSEITTHGGSIRVTSRKGSYDPSPLVEDFLNREQDSGIESEKGLKDLQLKINKIKKDSAKYLGERLAMNSTLSGYGAPAKAVTFITELSLQDLPWHSIIEDSQFKQGKYLPQSGIRLVSPNSYLNEIQGAGPTSVTMVILPWNVKTEVNNKIENLFNNSGIKYESVCLFPELTVTSRRKE